MSLFNQLIINERIPARWRRGQRRGRDGERAARARHQGEAGGGGGGGEAEGGHLQDTQVCTHHVVPHLYIYNKFALLWGEAHLCLPFFC